MEFGALANPKLMDRPDFQLRMNLPADPQHTLKRLEWLDQQGTSRGGTTKPAKLLTGCPVWNHPGWSGTLYPPKTSPKNALQEYSQRFHAIELNSTFYGIPEAETILRWKAEVAERAFSFCPKVPRAISHDRMLVDCAEITQIFIERMKLLGQNLGPCWLQLPPQFSPAQFDSLKNWILNDWKKGLGAPGLAVEFRHPGWFEENALEPRVTQLLEEAGCAAVITDTPGRRDVLHLTLTASWTFIRYTGNERHPYDLERLSQWTNRIDHWISKGLKGVLFFIHEPSEEKIPATVNDFIARINTTCEKHGIHVKSWEPFQSTLL